MPREAKKGGLSLLVSAETIYNRMRELRPDLLKKLFDPLATTAEAKYLKAPSH